MVVKIVTPWTATITSLLNSNFHIKLDFPHIACAIKSLLSNPFYATEYMVTH